MSGLTLQDIARLRLQNQKISLDHATSPEAVVAWLGALQAQDYNGALWSIGLRTTACTLQDVEQAILDRKIIRTWPMRGTLHFVAAADVRWLVKLLAPRATAAAASRRRQLELDDPTMQRAKTVLIQALSGGKCLPRNELCAELAANGIATSGQRGIHILRHYSEQALLCFGPHKGKEPTFVLLDEWVSTPTAKAKTREEALAELARRYFISHGPATIRDFAGWGFMTMTDAKAALALVHDELEVIEVADKSYYTGRPTPKPPTDQTAFLLPGFDEYMLGYKDRSLALAPEHSQKIVPGGNGMFKPTIVIDGQVVGTWKRRPSKSKLMIDVQPFTTLKPAAEQLVRSYETKYKNFLGL